MITYEDIVDALAVRDYNLTTVPLGVEVVLRVEGAVFRLNLIGVEPHPITGQLVLQVEIDV